MLDTEDDDHPVTMPFRDYSRRKRITFVVALVLLISLIVGVALVVHYVVVGSQSSSTVPPSLVTGGSSTDGAEPTTTNPVPTTTHSAPMQGTIRTKINNILHCKNIRILTIVVSTFIDSFFLNCKKSAIPYTHHSRCDTRWESNHTCLTTPRWQSHFLRCIARHCH